MHHCLLALATLESDVFLLQTFLTFTEDPFHQLCCFIPGCDNNNSWSELGLGLGETSLNNNINVRVVGQLYSVGKG
jgi:hypothetical protein